MVFRRAMMAVMMLVPLVACWADEALVGAEFIDQDMTDARFIRCELRRAHFERCRLDEAHLIQITQAPRLTLKSCRFEQSRWQQVLLADPDMNDVRIEGLDGYDLELDEWQMDRSELTDLYLRYCELREIRLENSTIRELMAEYCDIPRGRWRNVDFSDSNFEGCDLSDSRFYRGSFEDARFSHVDFSDVVLENCDIRGLVINGVRIDELID